MDFKQIKGLGEKRIQKLSEAGITNPTQLLLRFPVRYIDAKTVNDFTVDDGENSVIFGELLTPPTVRYIRKNLNIIRVSFDCDGTKVDCSWFNQRFVAKKLKIGEKFLICGKMKRFKNSFSLSAPSFLNERGIIPIYAKLSGLPDKVLKEAISAVLQRVKINSYLPDSIRSKYNLIPLSSAVNWLHFPQTLEEAENAGKTIAAENLSYNLSVFSLLKKNTSYCRSYQYKENGKKLEQFISTLPYLLTQDQIEALNQIISSMHENRRMNRLLSGDVGCGKTIVAMLAMYYAALSGIQSVMMAPTELLARQHFQSALRLFEPLGLKAELLCGSLNEKQRALTVFNIKNGADMVFGTHALLSGNVEFARLGLIITDEQHRFGVNQRAYLENKSAESDCLVMSATPIPRTLALTLYKDLDVSQIKTLPPKKAITKTKRVPYAKQKEMMDYIYKKAENGEQTYIVCPRISDEDDGLLSVDELYGSLKKSMAGYAGALNGKMKDAEKNRTMQRFALGEIKVLVCTTVVEVGLDVKNATTMVIFNAERYGLSQLHQLRGRVGRGEKDSYCFLLCDNLNDQTQKRLDYFCETGDGFELAQYDFEMRGAGDFLGTRQHGESSVKITPEILECAKNMSEEILCDDGLCEKILESVSLGNENYIKNITLN